MNADEILLAELRSSGARQVDDLTDSEIVDLVARYSIWLPIDTYLRAPWLAPYALRRIRIRIDERVGGPKRDLWGLPETRGYFTDDNSLIKGVVKGKPLSTASGVYGGRLLTSGLVCCHVWPMTTSDPLLFSFVPNLVWLPKSLARYSDVPAGHTPHAVHAALASASQQRFQRHGTRVAPMRVSQAWERLSSSGRVGLASGHPYGEFAVGNSVVDLVQKRLARLIGFLDAVDMAGTPERFSRRYHAGSGRGIDQSVPAIQELVTSECLRLLRDEMHRLAATPH